MYIQYRLLPCALIPDQSDTQINVQVTYDPSRDVKFKYLTNYTNRKWSSNDQKKLLHIVKYPG